MDTVRIGLVGCGSYAVDHMQAFATVPGIEVAAAYDLERGRAEALAARFSIPRVCGSLEEICGLENLVAIDVVATETEHYRPVMAALKAGKEVFVEKPLATDLKECRAMIDAARERDLILMVGHLLRFETKYTLIRQELDSGRLGRIVSMHARRNRPKTLLPVYGRTHPVLENSIHDIDLMLWYTGQPVTRVRGYGRKATGGRHHDTFWGVLEFAGGAVGVIETIWLLPQPAGVALDDAFQLIGTCGAANLQLFPGPLAFWREDGSQVPDVSYTSILREQLAHFCECVRTGRQPSIITPVEAMRAVRVALALIESAEAGRDIEIGDWE
ncbi:MAG TPA: Gfo/Idh/MocA family oxidoreductase [Bryobacteraceae bacterium]|nr:Gfo/Idh/MocA family oxidoreductase [Bryobacteraceae bacterium]